MPCEITISDFQEKLEIGPGSNCYFVISNKEKKWPLYGYPIGGSRRNYLKKYSSSGLYIVNLHGLHNDHDQDYDI